MEIRTVYKLAKFQAFAMGNQNKQKNPKTSETHKQDFKNATNYTFLPCRQLVKYSSKNIAKKGTCRLSL